jgi:hypothetical protein
MGRRVNWRNWRVGRTGPEEFLALVLLGLFMAAVIAFNAAANGFVARVVYWQINLLGGGAIAAQIEPRLERMFGLAARPRLRAVVQAIAMTFPITLLVWTVSGLMGVSPLSLVNLLAYFPSVLVVDIVVVVLAWLLRTTIRPRPPTATRRETNPLASRLEPRFARAALLAVEAEDHYLRVHTAAGQALVYMRFSDALGELAAGDGLRIHRSWWVARHAVDTVRWRNGRGEVALNSGVLAPVSRTYAADVRRASWV